MSKHYQRGLSSNQEQRSSALLRDTRPLAQKINEDILRKPLNATVLLFVLGAAGFVIPGLIDLFLLLLLLFFSVIAFQSSTLPFRLPKRANQKDKNDLAPGTKKPREARGIYFFGNSVDSNEELWFSNEDMRTHVLIFGSTGSGKTETLLSLSYNALIQSSGFIYVDGKGDNSLFSKVFSMVRYMGRLDDLLLINFMTGARDISGPQERRLSNTLNPFSQGSSSMLSNLVVSMMDSSGQGGDGDMWKGRAISFVEALMKILVAMRDSGSILLDANVIRNYFGLDRIEAMVLDKAFIRDGQYAVSMEGLADNIIEPMKNYLYNLPGYNKERRGKQVSQVFEQHGFITMQLTRVFSSLADAYGHILRTKLAEVDLRDVVLNRRILIVLLPALEKSPDELSNLGKVIISTLKVMMAAGLGDEVEGSYSDLILRKPTNAETPFLCILDEYGYYAVKGFAVVPAQARSLGFSVVFAGQDLPAFQKASKEEAASIGANTNIKICMKLEDPQETWEFFNKTAGESFVTQVESYQANSSTVSNAYQDSKSAKVEKRARVDLLDLKEQVEGEMHIFFKSKIVRARAFYANPKPVQELRLNQFLKVDLLEDAQLYTLVKGIEDFEALCRSGFKPVSLNSNQLITQVVQYFNQGQLPSLVDRGMYALVSLYDQHQSQGEMLEVETFTGQALNIFIDVELDSSCSYILGGSESYGAAMLNKKTLYDQLLYIEKLMGVDEVSAAQFTSDLIDDIQSATHYAVPSTPLIDVESLTQTVNALVSGIGVVKDQHIENEASE
ncbi:MAG: phosphoesterase [Legionellales bacterium]|nr:phosphoesterase [Legionellales bacterium]